MIDTLCIQGAGMKCISCIGALRVLAEKGILATITNFAGSSIGALVCLLLVIGMTPDEIEHTVSNSTPTPCCSISKYFICNYQQYVGNAIITYIESILSAKGFDPSITFLKLYNDTGKALVLTGTSVTVMDTYYFNYQTAPEMKVIDALRISVCIPLFNAGVQTIINGLPHVMIDGGAIATIPLYYFKF